MLVENQFKVGQEPQELRRRVLKWPKVEEDITLCTERVVKTFIFHKKTPVIRKRCNKEGRNVTFEEVGLDLSTSLLANNIRNLSSGQ